MCHGYIFRKYCKMTRIIVFIYYKFDKEKKNHSKGYTFGLNEVFFS